MATVRMTMTGMHVPWKVGEIVTVKVATDEGDGEFTCETIETFPADLKDQHVAALQARDLMHQDRVGELNQEIEGHKVIVADLTQRLEATVAKEKTA